MSKGNESGPILLEEARFAYRAGRSADFIQGFSNGDWGAVFAIPPRSRAAMENAGKQCNRSRAERVRHVRRARLRNNMANEGIQASLVEAVILTEFPCCEQVVVKLADGQLVRVERYLEDEALAALREAFMPSLKG